MNRLYIMALANPLSFCALIGSSGSLYFTKNPGFAALILAHILFLYFEKVRAKPKDILDKTRKISIIMGCQFLAFAVIISWGNLGNLWVFSGLGLCTIVHGLKYYTGSKVPTVERPDYATKDFPIVDMETLDQQTISTSDYLNKPCVFIFFRGSWCPFCVLQVSELQQNLQAFLDRGIEIALITGEHPDKLQSFSKTINLTMTILWDRQMILAKHFKILHENGHPLPVKFLGNDNKDLFLPTVILTGEGGKIIHMEVSEDFELRPQPSSIINIFDKLLFQFKLEQEVAEKTKEINLVLEENRGLVRTLVHDIANTQTVIFGTSTFALEYKNLPPEKLRKMWMKVEKAIQIQMEIVKTTSKMEAIRSGAQKIQLGPVPLLKAVEQCEFVFEDQLKNKNLRLVYDHQACSRAKVLAEMGSLSNNVLANLISNAIKFSQPGGEIQLSIKDEGDRTHLIVRDHGVGMPEKVKVDLFRPDKSTSRPGTSGERGTGFGMPLVKSYLALYGASIDVDSKDISNHPDDHGTTFNLTFHKAA